MVLQALLEQKISYLEKTLEEVREKESGYATELKNMKRDYAGNIKEATGKYENTIRKLQSAVANSNDQIGELETKGIEMKQTFESEKAQLLSELEETNEKLQEANKSLQIMREQMDEICSKYKMDKCTLEEQLEKIKIEYQEKITSLENSSKIANEEIKTLKIKWEKELAIKSQKQDFYEMQLSEAKKQLEEAHKSHDTMVKALEGKEDQVLDQEEASKQLVSMKETHLKEIKELEKIHEDARTRLTKQLEQMTEKASSLELTMKLQSADNTKLIETKTECINSLQEQLNKAIAHSKALELQKIKLLDEAEQNYKEVIKGLETQMDETVKKHQNDLKDVQKRSEDALAQLRNVYEVEKERLQTRVIEEKEKAGRFASQQIEEYEVKLKDEQQQRAEEVGSLQNELAECDLRCHEVITQLEQEAELSKQKIKTLEDQLKESKDQFNRLQSINSKSLEQQMNNFTEERKNMLEKIEKLSYELTVKERELTTYENKNLSLQQDIERTSKSIKEWKAERITEKTSLSEKIETLKDKNQQLRDELMQRKLEYSRESALLKQQTE